MSAAHTKPPPRYDIVVLRRNDFTVDGRVERQASYLGQRGLRVLVLAVGGEHLARNENREGFDLERLAAAHRWGTAAYYTTAVRRIIKIRPRVVHCHDLDTLLPGTVGAKVVGAKVVYDSAELWTERNNGYFGVRRRLDTMKYATLERCLIGSATAVITVSDGIAAELQQRYGIARPQLLYNVPRTPAGEPRSLRRRIGGDGPIVLHLGVVDMNRGLEHTVHALQQLPTTRLVLMGPTRPYVWGPLQTLAEELGVRDRIIHVPPVPRDEIVAWATEADVGLCAFEPVCLSHILALPNKFFEYAFAGVPIVASDLPEIGTWVREHRLGELCNPQDPDDIARAIKRVLESKQRPSSQSVEAFIARFAWEQQAERLWNIYEPLL